MKTLLEAITGLAIVAAIAFASIMWFMMFTAVVTAPILVMTLGRV